MNGRKSYPVEDLEELWDELLVLKEAYDHGHGHEA
jgi:hypothetical protein